jgi:hypothetical protein
VGAASGRLPAVDPAAGSGERGSGTPAHAGRRACTRSISVAGSAAAQPAILAGSSAAQSSVGLTRSELDQHFRY